MEEHHPKLFGQQQLFCQAGRPCQMGGRPITLGHTDDMVMLSKEEQKILDAIIAARKVQDFLWGHPDGSWGIEEWRRMFRKRVAKIDEIDESNPHAVVEFKKRLLQVASLSVALMEILDNGMPVRSDDAPPSNLPQYSDKVGDH